MDLSNFLNKKLNFYFTLYTFENPFIIGSIFHVYLYDIKMIGAMINEIIIKHPLQDIKDFGTLPCCALWYQ